MEDAVDEYETLGKFYQFTSTSTVTCTETMTYIFWPNIQSVSPAQVTQLLGYTGVNAKRSLKTGTGITVLYYDGEDDDFASWLSLSAVLALVALF